MSGPGFLVTPRLGSGSRRNIFVSTTDPADAGPVSDGDIWYQYGVTIPGSQIDMATQQIKPKALKTADYGDASIPATAIGFSIPDALVQNVRYMTAHQSLNASSVAFQELTQLSMPISPGKYRLEAMLIYVASTTEDIQFKFNLLDGVMTHYFRVDGPNKGAGSATASQANWNEAGTYSADADRYSSGGVGTAANNTVVAHLRGWADVTDGGTLQVLAAQLTSTASQPIVRIGSYLWISEFPDQI